MNRMVMAIFAFTLTINSSQAADSLPVTPGLWEMTSTTTNPMMGTRTYTNQKCMKEFKFDPEDMMEGMPKDACELNSNVSGNTMTYDMSCNMDGGEMTGNGKFTVAGDLANGQMSMQMSIGGQTMEMTMTSEGKRVGDC